MQDIHTLSQQITQRKIALSLHANVDDADVGKCREMQENEKLSISKIDINKFKND